MYDFATEITDPIQLRHHHRHLGRWGSHDPYVTSEDRLRQLSEFYDIYWFSRNDTEHVFVIRDKDLVAWGDFYRLIERFKPLHEWSREGF